MGINVGETGSVYTQRPLDLRAEHPLYQSVRELVRRHSVTGNVLDIGCSDGVATAGLDEVQVFGVDLNPAVLQTAREHDPQYRGVIADMRSLPFSKRTLAAVAVDTVLALDILEHEKRADTVQALENLRSMMPAEHTVIASMPIISVFSVETLRESYQVFRQRRMPETGLFDRTHKILRGRGFHHKMFGTAGYDVAERYMTNKIEHVTGDWDWKIPEVIATDEQIVDGTSAAAEAGERTTLLKFAARAVRKGYALAHESNSQSAQRASEALVAYQGLYVLKPALAA